MNRKQRRQQQKTFVKTVNKLKDSFEHTDPNWFLKQIDLWEQAEYEAMLFKIFGITKLPDPPTRIIFPSFEMNQLIDGYNDHLEGQNK